MRNSYIFDFPPILFPYTVMRPIYCVFPPAFSFTYLPSRYYILVTHCIIYMVLSIHSRCSFILECGHHIVGDRKNYSV